MPRELVMAGRVINDDQPPLVIAELGNNHSGSVATAKAMIDMVARAGGECVKFQKRSNNTLYTQALLGASYVNENSFGVTYGAHREAIELSAQALCGLFSYAAQRNVIAFATAFDEASADQLMALGVPAIKLASGALTDIPLQKHVASLGVPIVLSTGGGTERDIDRAVLTLEGRTSFALLHCTAAYPLAPAEANLRCILSLRKRYPNTVIGFSSHSPGLAFSLIAAAFGASIIEHHVTLNRASKGTDHAFSLEPKGLETLIEDVKKLHVALGDGVKQFYRSEYSPIGKMRRHPTPEGWCIDGAVDAHD